LICKLLVEKNDVRAIERIMENGGHFVTRLKNGAYPLITGKNLKCRGNTIDVVGKRISDVLPKLKRQVLDVEVEVNFRRRAYQDKE